MVSPVFVLFSVGLLPSFTAALSCPGLNGTLANKKNAHIYPDICLNKTVPMRTSCYWVCNKGFGFQDGSHTETECNLQRYDDVPDWRNYFFYNNECKTTTKCPPLDSYDNKGYAVHHCETDASSPGYVCEARHCGNLRGPKEKICQNNGTWMPLGGPFCKPALPITIHCQNKVFVKTDPGKATADVTSKFSFPVTGIAESEVLVEGLDKKDLKALPKGWHTIKYVINTKGSQYGKYCSMVFEVFDKEPPRAVRCPKHLLFTAPPGFKARIELNSSSSEVKFIDNVDKVNSFQQHSDKHILLNSLQPPGVYTMQYSARDSSGNMAHCEMKVIVKSKKPCGMKVPPPNANPAVKLDGSYYSSCHNDTSSLCEGSYTAWTHFDFLRCDLSILPNHMTGVNCIGGLLSKPLVGCVNNTAVVDAVNGTCPNATVLGSGAKRCFPCERSMFYNETAKMCHVCPPNTTNHEFGSRTCFPCPPHQITKLTKAPRFCEDICSLGSWLDSSNTTCTTCNYGSYAPAGARACMKCPDGLTTLDEASQSSLDCVFGEVILGDSGSKQINFTAGATNNASVYQLKIKPNAFKDPREYRPIALQFRSQYLQQIANCSKDFVRVTAVKDGVAFHLTGQICGANISNPVFVDTTASGLTVEFAFADASMASLGISFGRADCRIGEYFNFSTTLCTKCPLNTYQDKMYASSCIRCGNETVARETGAMGCVALCPKGTFVNGTSCSGCPVGSYQDMAEMSQCVKCPNNTVTRRSHSTAITDCVEPCNAGQYKTNDGCKSCPTGMFQDISRHAYEFCKFCPSGTTTINNGSNSVSSCVVACAYEGEYYDPKDGKCKKCPIGSYKLASDKQLLRCTDCPTNHTTNRVGAASITECIDTYDNCSPNPCKFPGWCEDTGTSFKCHCPYNYAGELCENRTHACESQPCLNNATCHNLYLGGSQYRCKCPVGFTGVNCENVFYPCNENKHICYPGNCTNTGGGSFSCKCPPWYEGTRCEIKRNQPCWNHPCGHGDCKDGPHQDSKPPFTCSCYPDYTGKNCTIVIDDCIGNDCNTTGTQACEDRERRFHCRCKMGFFGNRCENALGCPPGETFQVGKCHKCGVGTYQPLRGDHPCQACPDKKITLEEGATSKDQCIEKEDFVKVRASVRITSESWSSDFLNKESVDYNRLRVKLEETLKILYAKESKYIRILIANIRQGSIICDFTLYFKSGVESPTKALTTELATGSLGNFTVDKDFSKAVVVKEPAKEKKNNYTLMAVLLVVGILVVIGVVTLCLLHSRHKKRARVRFDKMLMDETATIEYPMAEK